MGLEKRVRVRKSDMVLGLLFIDGRTELLVPHDGTNERKSENRDNL